MPKLASKRTLTAVGCAKIRPPASGRANHWDAAVDGLALRITETGARSWVVQRRIKGGGVVRITLGGFADLSLADARKQAAALVERMERGEDPRGAVTAARVEQAARDALTYETAVAEFIERHAKARRGNRTWPETRRLLLTTAGALKGRPLASITRRQVHATLDAIMAAGTPYAANRTYAALQTFFRWCDARDMLDRNPITGVERPFDGETARDRSWSDCELASIWRAADEIGGSAGAALKVLMLTGARRGEVFGMEWCELSDDGALWHLPAARAKSKKSRQIPLSSLAQRIIAARRPAADAKDKSPLVFPTANGRPIRSFTQLAARVRKLSNVPDFTFHQSRHTLRTGLDRLNIAPHVKDEALGHARQGVGDRHYSHHDYLDEQCEAFEAWAAHVQRAVYGADVAIFGA